MNPTAEGSTRMTLEEVLGVWRADARVLARAEHPEEAALLERHARQVESAASDYLTWLTEADAQRRSGHSVEWLRARFPDGSAMGTQNVNGAAGATVRSSFPHGSSILYLKPLRLRARSAPWRPRADLRFSNSVLIAGTCEPTGWLRSSFPRRISRIPSTSRS